MQTDCGRALVKSLIEGRFMQSPPTHAGKICVLTARTPNAETETRPLLREIAKRRRNSGPSVPLRLSTPQQEGFKVQRQSEQSKTPFTCLDMGGVEGAAK